MERGQGATRIGREITMPQLAGPGRCARAAGCLPGKSRWGGQYKKLCMPVLYFEFAPENSVFPPKFCSLCVLLFG